MILLQIARRFISGSLMLVAANTVAFGQQDSQGCPTLELILPNGILQVEEEATFVAKISGNFESKVVAFKWTSSRGKIVAGQGTQAVNIVTNEDDEGISLKVSVEVVGLPKHCVLKASESIGVAQLPIGEPADELGRIGRKKDDLWHFLGRLDVYISLVQQSPGYEGFMTVEFNSKDTRRHKIRHLQRIYDHFAFRKFDLTRITFAIAEHDYPEKTILWTMAPNARIPKYARSYRIVKAEDYKSRVNDLIPKR